MIRKPLMFVALVLTLALAAGAEAWAGNDQAVRIVVSGNFQGKTFDLDGNHRLSPTDVWKIPALIKLIKAQPGAPVFTVDVGNNHSIFQPSSFLLNGEIEASLGELCGFNVSAMGPADLEMLSCARPNYGAMLRRVWTNVFPKSDGMRFNHWHLSVFNGLRITVTSFISPDYLVDVPLKRNDLEVEDPSRAMRRYLAMSPPTDLLIMVAHLRPEELDLLRPMIPKNTIILRPVQTPQEQPDTHRGPGSLNADTHELEIPSGRHGVMVITRTVHTRKMTRIKQVFFKPQENDRIDPAADKSGQRLRSILSEPLKVITTREVPYPAMYKFSRDYNSFMTKKINRSDLALTAVEGEPYKSERVVTKGFLVSELGNRKTRVYRLIGSDLKRLFLMLGRDRFPYRLGVSGIDIDWLLTELVGLRVGGNELDVGSVYSLALDSLLYQDPRVSMFLEQVDAKWFPGRTLWEAWMTFSHVKTPASKLIER